MNSVRSNIFILLSSNDAKIEELCDDAMWHHFLPLMQSVNLSAANSLQTEEELLCCVCLHVFTDPFTCGHNFCKTCITQRLNFNSQHRSVRRVKSLLTVNISSVSILLYLRWLLTSDSQIGKKARNSSEQTSKSFLWNSYWNQTESPSVLPVVSMKSASSNSLKTDPLINNIYNMAGSMCDKRGKPLKLLCKTQCADFPRFLLWRKNVKLRRKSSKHFRLEFRRSWRKNWNIKRSNIQ